MARKELKNEPLAEAILELKWEIPPQVIGRRVSRGEALRISRSILERAERERLALADYEAQRGIQWDD